MAQFVRPVPRVAAPHTPLLAWHHTFETCTLSLAVPLTVNSGALLQRWFAVGAVIASVGLATSTKLACRHKLDCITKRITGLLVNTSPAQVVQLLNTNPPVPLDWAVAE